MFRRLMCRSGTQPRSTRGYGTSTSITTRRSPVPTGTRTAWGVTEWLLPLTARAGGCREHHERRGRDAPLDQSSLHESSSIPWFLPVLRGMPSRGCAFGRRTGELEKNFTQRDHFGENSPQVVVS